MCLIFFNMFFDEDNHSFTGVSTAEKNMRKKEKNKFKYDNTIKSLLRC